MKGWNLREMKENISELFKITNSLATLERVNELSDDLKELKLLVDKHTSEIQELRDLLASGSGAKTSSASAVSGNDFMLLRNRVRYLLVKL